MYACHAVVSLELSANNTFISLPYIFIENYDCIHLDFNINADVMWAFPKMVTKFLLQI
jgi:hypothetical protein